MDIEDGNRQTIRYGIVVILCSTWTDVIRSIYWGSEVAITTRTRASRVAKNDHQLRHPHNNIKSKLDRLIPAHAIHWLHGPPSRTRTRFLELVHFLFQHRTAAHKFCILRRAMFLDYGVSFIFFCIGPLHHMTHPMKIQRYDREIHNRIQ